MTITMNTTAGSALVDLLRGLGPVALAVSGGVDSMTLATLAHRVRSGQTEMFHAVSPAVPAEATERVRAHAAQEGWSLRIIDAGEFGDPQYLANPVDRCYFCKTDLYGTIASHTDGLLLSGTNTDDLGEYRPGLRAAEQHGVRHPYVETGFTKQAVRALARELGLPEFAELPAAPCLASRVETGIVIDPRTLGAVHRVERALTELLGPRDVRCRVRKDQVDIELDEHTLSSLAPSQRVDLLELAGRHWPGRRVTMSAYRRGSAFLKGRSPDAGRQ